METNFWISIDFIFQSRSLTAKKFIKEVSLVAILMKNIYSNSFPLSSCQYVSAIPEKTACYRPFKNGHFVRVCAEKTMDHQYKENGARNIYSIYNQIRAYVECSPNQSKNIIPYLPLHPAIDETLKILEKCLPFLYLNSTRAVLQLSSTSPWLLLLYVCK